MIGADADNLKAFVGDATSWRTAELGKAKPLNVVGIDIQFNDGRQGHLRWSTGLIDSGGTPLPDDWIVTVDG
jgi:hypothetical protein